MQQMLRDIQHAFRSLTRRPTFSLLSIGILALGIGLATSAFDVVDGLLLQTLPFDHPERILVLSDASPARGLFHAALSYPAVVDVQASSRSFEAIAVVRPLRTLITDPPTVPATGTRVSSAFFRVFGIKPRLGRPLLPSDDTSTGARSIVLSARAWQEWYAGQPSVIGRTVALDSIPYTVVGVMPARFDYPTGTEFWIPFVPESFAADRASHYVSAVGRLAPHASAEEAGVELRGIAARLSQEYPASDAEWQLEAEPVHEFLLGDTRPKVALAGAAALLVLLIACANVASLSLAQGATRQAEIAVRRALGASAGQLIRQAFTESLLLALAGAIVGALAAQAAAGVLRSAVPGPIPAWVSFSVHLRTLGFVAAAAILSTVVSGVAPAVSTARVGAPDLLGGRRSTASRPQQRMRRGIVIAQVALATALLAAAGLLSESLFRLRGVEPGFDPQGVVTAHVMLTGSRYTAVPARERFYEEALERLRALPNVQAAGATDALPLASGINRFAFVLENQPRPAKGSEPIARRALVTPDYLGVLRIPLLRGRDFGTHDDAEHPRVALVSTSWARQFLPGLDPIGQRFLSLDGQSITIVGEVGDVRHDGLQSAGQPTVYTPLAQDPALDMTLVVRVGCDVPVRDGCDDGTRLGSTVRQVVTQTDPSVAVYTVESMPDVLRGSLSGRRVGATLSAAFALLAVVLASAGIYGLMALYLSLRRREVGIRLALGARRHDVRWRLLSEGVQLACTGAVLGLGLTALSGRLMGNLLYGVKQTSAPTLLLAGGLMVFVGALASWGPAERAARISPASALRSE